jgi:hypothetical protein
MRAHLYRTILKSDASGPLDPGAQVRVLQPDSSLIIPGTLYADGSSGTTLNNPLTLAGATLDLYLDTPQRVDLGITPAGSGTEYVVHGQDAILPKDDAVVPAQQETWPFYYTGLLVVTTGTQRLTAERNLTILSVRATVGSAPAGSSIIVDVKKNGTTIFTDTAHRPTIAAGSNTALVTTIDVPSLNTGDYLTVDIVQVGSTTAGSDLTVTVEVSA